MLLIYPPQGMLNAPTKQYDHIVFKPAAIRPSSRNVFLPGTLIYSTWVESAKCLTKVQ